MYYYITGRYVFALSRVDSPILNGRELLVQFVPSIRIEDEGFEHLEQLRKLSYALFALGGIE